MVYAMAAAITADGRVDREEQARAAGSLDRFGIGEPERRLLVEAVREPRPLGPLLDAIQAANLGSYAYAASLLAAEPAQHRQPALPRLPGRPARDLRRRGGEPQPALPDLRAGW